jgi:hypothetical protein
MATACRLHVNPRSVTGTFEMFRAVKPTYASLCNHYTMRAAFLTIHDTSSCSPAVLAGCDPKRKQTVHFEIIYAIVLSHGPST